MRKLPDVVESGFTDVRSFYRFLLTRSFDTDRQFDLVSEYAFAALGRKTWFVDNLTAESMLSARVDENLENVQIPHDAMAIVFERGFEIEPGIPLRWVRTFAPRADLTKKVLNDVIEIVDNGGFGKGIMFDADLSCGYDYKLSRTSEMKTRKQWPMYDHSRAALMRQN